MSRRYDSRTTTFSPEGRLYQVEYAMEAISHAGTCIGVLASDGVVLAGEKRVTSKLLQQDASSEKIYAVSANCIAGVAGLTADANSLVNYARNAAQDYLASYDDDMPVELITQRLSNLKQSYTQYGGLRPFGVSILYAGWDAHHGFQLYHSDPSGNTSGWKATAIGHNSGMATSLLKTDYPTDKDAAPPVAGSEQAAHPVPDFDLKKAAKLATKVLSKVLDASTLEPEKGTCYFVLTHCLVLTRGMICS